ncbi:hypothetical protein FA95DRAFT_1600904 [Auriscalpium vulgare]|uniref:Uncharacterized protein n=1 Tax=Auriscalpium vulgare TaxID=40419 RepID=A0ACB8SD07_9AGAM|nr:hypothetical protein FA95DRAFT_1600904 [Auriscalpium vulgare]
MYPPDYSLSVFKAWNDDHAVAMCQTLAVYLKKKPVIANPPAPRLPFRDQLRRFIDNPALQNAFQSASAATPSAIHPERDMFRIYNDYQAISLCEALAVYLAQNPIAAAGSRRALEAELRTLALIPTFKRVFKSTDAVPAADPSRQVLLFDDDKLQDILRRCNEDDEFSTTLLVASLDYGDRSPVVIPAALNTMAFILNALPLPPVLDSSADLDTSGTSPSLTATTLLHPGVSDTRKVITRFDGYLAHIGFPPVFCHTTCTIKAPPRTASHLKRKRSSPSLSPIPSNMPSGKKARHDSAAIETAGKGLTAHSEAASSSSDVSSARSEEANVASDGED